MWTQISQLQPKPRWFLLAPAAAVLLVEVLLVWPWLRHPHVLITPIAAVSALKFSLLYLPLGVWRVLLGNIGAYHEYWGIFSYAGWSVLLVLIAAGLQYPRRKIFFALVLLLLLSVIGFPVRLAIESIKSSLMW